MSILETIHGHDDLVKLTPQQQSQLCGEIRDFLVAHVAKTGGHLASNLGVVELTIALETVYDTGTDRLVFDVGHQSYVHKLLTGRLQEFENLRQFGGIAGFPKPSESETDAFVAGHASSSVSIGLGMARARTLLGKEYDVAVVIGDGSATGGMAYEGLNDAAVSKEPMVIVLNDNEMSIDVSVGGLSKHLRRLRTKKNYLGLKESYRSLLKKIPGGDSFLKVTQQMKNAVKRFLLQTTIFENMGLSYLGPVDGHDLPELIRLLRVARSMKEPVLLHVMTQKGRGYTPAEERPDKFHGVGKFDPLTGETVSGGGGTFTDAFSRTMLRLAEKDARICAITAAMPGGTGLIPFREAYPKRLFDVGIAEEHAVSMAGGLAKQGMVPVVAVYSTFLQRSYDQILQDVGLLNLHVVFAVDRAGLVGEDGETHHGVFDTGYLSQVPGMTVLAPCCCRELDEMLEWAAEDWEGPVAVRYPRGGEPEGLDCAWPERKVVCHHPGDDLTLITYGTLTRNVLDAADVLEKEGLRARVLRLAQIHPIPEKELLDSLAQGPVIVLEEAMAGSGIAESIGRIMPEKRVFSRDLGKKYVSHGKTADLLRSLGLDGPGIAQLCREVARNEK